MAQISAQASTAVKTSSAAPVRKVTFGALGGAVATIALWLLSDYGNVHPSPAVAAAITTVITFVVSYLVPPSAKDTPVPQ